MGYLFSYNVNTPTFAAMDSISLPVSSYASNPFASAAYVPFDFYGSNDGYTDFSHLMNLSEGLKYYKSENTPYIPPLYSSSSAGGYSFASYSGSGNIFDNISQSSSYYNAPNIKGRTLSRDNSQYGPAFLNRVKQIAKRINCNYRDLLGVMNSESGINSRAKNPYGSATGLIQFVESTARGLGTTTAALRAMSPLQQLDYVEKFLVANKRAAGFSDKHKLSAGDLYSLVFLPARAKREVLTQRGEAYYSANYALDKNRDGKITKSELANRVHSFYVSDNSFLA